MMKKGLYKKKHIFFVRFSQKLKCFIIVFQKSSKKQQKDKKNDKKSTKKLKKSKSSRQLHNYSYVKVDSPYILYKKVKEAQKKHSLKPVVFEKQYPEVEDENVILDFPGIFPIPDNAKMIN